MPSMTPEELNAKYGPMHALLGLVFTLNINDMAADLSIDGQTYTVTPNLCSFCGAASGEDCVHKAITRAVVAEAVRLERFEQDVALEEDMAQMLDHADQQAETYAVMAGVG